MCKEYLRISCIVILVVLVSCRNKCRYIECAQDVITFQINDYSSYEIQDSLLKVLYKEKYQNPFISKGNGQFSVDVYGSGFGNLSIYYQDTLKAEVLFNLSNEEGECCNYFIPTEININGELQCMNDCSSRGVFDIEF